MDRCTVSIEKTEHIAVLPWRKEKASRNSRTRPENDYNRA